jgi:hypothetical protein
MYLGDGIGTSAGSFLAVDGDGLIIATSTPTASVDKTANYDWTGNHTFTNASTTGFAITDLGTAAGSFLAVNANGTVIATSTPAGGIDWTEENAGTIHATNYVDNNTTYTAGNGLTLAGTSFSINFARDNTWTGTQTFNWLSATTSLDYWFNNSGGVTGNSNIVTVGTIGTGTWEGTAIADAYVADDITASNYLPLTGGTLTGAATSTFLYIGNDLTVAGNLSLPNDSITDAMIDWANLTDLNAGGEVAWSNLASGELTSEVLILGTDVKAGTLTDTKLCTWDDGNSQIVCDTTDSDTAPSGSNNEVLTDDGSNGFVSESNLTFDGSLLTITGDLTVQGATSTSFYSSGDITAGGTIHTDTVDDTGGGNITFNEF